MSTTLLELPVTDENQNEKTLVATSFYGGFIRGQMLSITVRFNEYGRYTQADLTKEQALELARAINEKFGV